MEGRLTSRKKTQVITVVLQLTIMYSFANYLEDSYVCDSCTSVIPIFFEFLYTQFTLSAFIACKLFRRATGYEREDGASVERENGRVDIYRIVGWCVKNRWNLECWEKWAR